MAEKLPSGKYRSRATYTGENGKRHSVSFTRDTAKEADYAALEFKLGKRRTAAPTSMTVGEAVTAFIEANDSVLSPSTIVGYRRIYKNYISAIENIPLHKLDNNTLQSWVNQLARKHSPKTVSNAYGLVSTTLRTYAPEFSPRVNLPRKAVRDVQIPQREDIELLLKLTEGTRLHLPILLGAHCGLRRSEMSALTWKDIDLKNRKIKIRHAMVQGEYGWVIKQPKSAAGTRVVDMTNAVHDYLASADKSQPPVPINPTTITNDFGDLCRANGLSYNQHLLRHYYASVLASRGIPIKYAQMLMGHSSGEMLNKVYAHILKEEEERFRSSVTSYFNG